tara:strand:+ start:289 stop:495 length:207 start_codon:yes stop_codon:yes gene_type:complete
MENCENKLAEGITRGSLEFIIDCVCDDESISNTFKSDLLFSIISTIKDTELKVLNTKLDHIGIKIVEK